MPTPYEAILELKLSLDYDEDDEVWLVFKEIEGFGSHVSRFEAEDQDLGLAIIMCAEKLEKAGLT